MTDFILDPRLEADTFDLKELDLSKVLLMNDARYPWVILVPRINGVREIHDLSKSERHQLMDESCWLAELMMDYFDIEKMNIGALGNLVPQLHLHHIGRHSGDPAWPGPVWGHSPATLYHEDDVQRVKTYFRC